MNRTRLAVTVLALTLVTGCSIGSDDEPDAQPAPAEASGTPMHEPHSGPAIPAVTWDDDVRHRAENIAGGAVATFVYKPEASPEAEAEWWAELSQYLTPAAQVAYARTDPANVPGTRVTSEPAAVQGASEYLATAVVPTDAGRYEVLLTQTTGDWQVERITPPTS